MQQIAAQIPWFHNCVLLDELSELGDRIWYAKVTVQHGWSRNVFVHQIESALHNCREKAVTNFDQPWRRHSPISPSKS